MTSTSDFPATVEVDGHVFRRAVFHQPYPHVVAQYREATAERSKHLKVFADGSYVIDHVDRYNPDRGHPVEHFFVDHPLGQAMARHPVLTAAAALLVVALLVVALVVEALG